MNSEYLVELEHIDKTFRTHHVLLRDEDTGRRRLFHTKTVHAARDISFGIRPGEIFGLLGPNGAGKTTTVKMVSGLVRPDRGSVYVDGLDVDRKRLQVLKRVGVVLEGTRTSIWPLTPLENLTYYGNLKNVRGSVLRKRAVELLKFIGLKEKMNVQVRRLSRGQKQKLAICIALIADPPVILLDEPTTGLDVQSSRNIKDKVIEMTRELGKCVLVTTHDMHVAQELCDRIGIINEGRLVTCKSTEDLLGLFSEHVFELQLDRAVAPGAFESIPGIVSVDSGTVDGRHELVLTFVPDLEVRSRALYAAMDRLSAGGCLVQNMAQRQQTLENVFLQITGAPSVPEER